MKLIRLTTLALVAIAMAAGCAQDVEDIDRTQPNALKKSDFEGVWYMRQTVVDVPGTYAGPFVGIASSMEKVRFEIQEDALIAYRAYQQIPGYDHRAGEKNEEGVTQYADGQEEGRTDEYKEAPIAVFPIISHFDIQRSYNPSTGEQSNVISENRSDRPWDERKYMRVDWGRNLLTLSYPDFVTNFSEFSYYVGETEESIDQFYEERETVDGEKVLRYFDFTQRAATGANELKLRNSFYRLPEYQRDYQPIHYDDEMMTKFGYFRTNRLVYDRATGFNDSSEIKLASRFDIWEDDFKRDPDTGEYLRDAEGRRIPVPMTEREPKPVVYYLSPNFPEDIRKGAEMVEEDWNVAFVRAAAAAKGMEPDAFEAEYGPMFVLCSNPVTEDDHEACDPRSEELKEAQDNEPYMARAGDVRKSFIFWVDQPQASGPLGYGPSYPDPETGEIVSGTAYVYGAGVDSYAGRGVDIVRLANGDFTEEELREGEDIIAQVLADRDPDIDPRGSLRDTDRLDELDKIPLDEGMDFLLKDRQRELFERIQTDGLEDLRANPNRDKRILRKLKDSGFDEMLMDDEYIRGISDGDLDPAKLSEQEWQEIMDDSNPFDLKQTFEKQQEKFDMYARDNVYLAEFADEAVVGTALEFKGETDYDKIWNELRNRIFHGVMAHEVGHTIGLRHNFQGSWDSVNYHDEYWELRKENWKYPETIADLYEANSLTEKQIEEGMMRYQYSTIMDYHARFDSDSQGIGKYDEAAILFAYSFGTYDDLDETHEGPIPVEEGYVEVFNDVSESVQLSENFEPTNAKSLFHSYDDRYAASQHPLEDFHYTTVVSLLGGPEKLTDRSLVKYSELREKQENEDPDRPVEVPYMFCSDEWRGATISCQTWDLGADPLEKVQWAVKSYESYYPLTHFRRDRKFFSLGSALNSSYRAMSIMPFVYQQWFFDRFYSSDQTLSNYYTIAAFAGINFLGDIMSKPQYGTYQYDDNSGFYELVSYDSEYQPDEGAADLRVTPGEGRRYYSQYDYGSGYYYFTRIEEVGHYWDWRVALETLAASTTTTVLGVDTAADFRTYMLPYYLMFQGELTEHFNNIFLQDYEGVAPLGGSKGVRSKNLANLQANGQPFDPLTGAAIPSDNGEKPIRTRINFTQRIYTMIYGFSFFTQSSYSQDYVNQGRIFRLGSGEQVLPVGTMCEQLGVGEDCSDDTHEVIYFTDPTSGITYGTIRFTGGTENPGLAETIVQRGIDAEAAMESATTQDQFNQALRDMQDVTEDAVMLSEAVEALGNVLF